MKPTELRELLKRGPVVVKFGNVNEHFDSILEEGMMGEIISMSNPDDYNVCEVRIDLSKYEERNKEFMTSSWYNDDGVACLNSYEADMYPADNIEKLFLDEGDEIQYFTFTSDNPLFARYLQEKKEDTYDGSYVEWLEKQLTACGDGIF